VLYQMRRSLFAPVSAPQFPEGVRLRTFEPGQDNQAWLALNRRAFADLPDQGRWTENDLALRLAESWFDPAGFLLAEQVEDGQLLGFHWTKVHGSQRHDHGGRASEHDDHDHDPIGEVYVLGIDPGARGLGLGVALTLAGLRHLREGGLDQVMLYVDESNTQAVALYRKLDFARWSTDVSFVRPAD
jgi:mycothiol synthase